MSVYWLKHCKISVLKNQQAETYANIKRDLCNQIIIIKMQLLNFCIDQKTTSHMNTYMNVKFMCTESNLIFLAFFCIMRALQRDTLHLIYCANEKEIKIKSCVFNTEVFFEMGLHNSKKFLDTFLMP